MIVQTSAGPIDLGETGANLSIGIIDFSKRVTDDFGVTTVAERGFSRRLSVQLLVPYDEVDALQKRMAVLRGTSALWVADDRFAAMSVQGFYKDFSVDLNTPPVSFCSLTVEGLPQAQPPADIGGEPAADGQASTFMVIDPVTIGDGTLAASNVPENDYAQWAAGTGYSTGSRVVRAHRIWEALKATTGDDPTATVGAWLDTGPTNSFAMFDQALGTITARAGSIAVTINASMDAVALLDVVGATVRVQAHNYDRTIDVGTDAILFLDMPSVSQATITIAGPGTVSVGTLLAGRLGRLGITERSPSAGITDFSRKDTDDFGDTTIVERGWAKRAEVKSLIRTDAIDQVFYRVAAVRARPALWIGAEGTDTLTIYGFFRDFSIDAGPNVSKLSIVLEGLSRATPAGQSTKDQLDEIAEELALAANSIDRGAYDPAATYVRGNVVSLSDGSRWRFVGATSASGSAPALGNPLWYRLQGPLVPIDNAGTPLVDLIDDVAGEVDEAFRILSLKDTLDVVAGGSLTPPAKTYLAKDLAYAADRYKALVERATPLRIPLASITADYEAYRNYVIGLPGWNDPNANSPIDPTLYGQLRDAMNLALNGLERSITERIAQGLRVQEEMVPGNSTISVVGDLITRSGTAAGYQVVYSKRSTKGSVLIRARVLPDSALPLVVGLSVKAGGSTASIASIRAGFRIYRDAGGNKRAIVIIAGTEVGDWNGGAVLPDTVPIAINYTEGQGAGKVMHQIGGIGTTAQLTTSPGEEFVYKALLVGGGAMDGVLFSASEKILYTDVLDAPPADATRGSSLIDPKYVVPDGATVVPSSGNAPAGTVYRLPTGQSNVRFTSYDGAAVPGSPALTVSVWVKLSADFAGSLQVAFAFRDRNGNQVTGGISGIDLSGAGGTVATIVEGVDIPSAAATYFGAIFGNLVAGSAEIVIVGLEGAATRVTAPQAAPTGQMGDTLVPALWNDAPNATNTGPASLKVFRPNGTVPPTRWAVNDERRLAAGLDDPEYDYRDELDRLTRRLKYPYGVQVQGDSVIVLPFFASAPGELYTLRLPNYALFPWGTVFLACSYFSPPAGKTHIVGSYGSIATPTGDRSLQVADLMLPIANSDNVDGVNVIVDPDSGDLTVQFRAPNASVKAISVVLYRALANGLKVVGLQRGGAASLAELDALAGLRVEDMAITVARNLTPPEAPTQYIARGTPRSETFRATTLGLMYKDFTPLDKVEVATRIVDANTVMQTARAPTGAVWTRTGYVLNTAYDPPQANNWTGWTQQFGDAALPATTDLTDEAGNRQNDQSLVTLYGTAAESLLLRGAKQGAYSGNLSELDPIQNTKLVGVQEKADVTAASLPFAIPAFEMSVSRYRNLPVGPLLFYLPRLANGENVSVNSDWSISKSGNVDSVINNTPATGARGQVTTNNMEGALALAFVTSNYDGVKVERPVYFQRTSNEPYARINSSMAAQTAWVDVTGRFADAASLNDILRVLFSFVIDDAATFDNSLNIQVKLQRAAKGANNWSDEPALPFGIPVLGGPSRHIKNPDGTRTIDIAYTANTVSVDGSPGKYVLKRSDIGFPPSDPGTLDWRIIARASSDIAFVRATGLFGWDTLGPEKDLD